MFNMQKWLSKRRRASVKKKIKLYREEAPAYFKDSEIYYLAVQAKLIKPVSRKLRKEQKQWCYRNITIAVDYKNDIYVGLKNKNT